MTTKIQMNEDQRQLCQQYVDMLHTIEEAFEYVLASFDDFSKTEGDVVLSDIFTGLTQLAGSNKLLSILFKENKEVKKTLEGFEEVVSEAMKLDCHFAESEFKQKTVQEDIFPTFHTWSLHIQKVLQPHIGS
jgi:SMC interacting uncharacterized protein involved in chromosome segregation